MDIKRVGNRAPHQPWVATGAGLILVLLMAWPARADDQPLERATKLRDAASVDWNEKKHADAVTKLRAALEIYDTTEGERPVDRAITLRALIWNLVRAGDVPATQEPFAALMDLSVADEALYAEVKSAFSAIWEAASKAATLAEAQAILESVRQAAAARSLTTLVGQTTHSLGSLASKHKDIDAAAGYYEEAVSVRHESGDVVGELWSLNNLANLQLTNDGLKAGLAHLKRAYLLMHTERVLPPQQSVAWNVKKAIEGLLAAPDKAGVKWLLELSKASARSGFGAAIPPSYLDRQALAVAEKGGKSAEILKLAGSLVKRPVKRDVPELAADLKIRAALAAYHAGKSKQGRGWLNKLDVGEGPCRPHLDARRKTVLAISHANKRGKKSFPEAAREAAAAWRDLGDFRGRVNALAAIVDAAEGAALADLIPKVGKESKEASRSGGPGGAGGSASSGGDRSKAKDLPLDEPVFHLYMDGQTVVLEDRVAKQTSKRALKWKPARVGLNGLTVLLFGGYVVVDSINYGGSSSAAAAPGSTTLDALGVYMPIPAKGALLIQKNGAVRYETAPISPR